MKDTAKKWLWVAIAIAAYIVLSTVPTPAGLEIAGQKSLALMVAAVVLWATEAIPVGYVSIALPMITAVLGICPVNTTLSNFVNNTLIFMMASQLIAKAFVEIGLGNRVALKVSFIFGNSPKKVLLAFMLATSLISMFLVDIPCAMIFGAIAYGLLQKNDCLPGKSKFGMSMMVGIPIGAAIGGFGTPVGSGLNQLTIGQLKAATGVEINFAQWTMIGLPMALILVFLAWFIISAMLPAEISVVKGSENIKEESAALGALSKDEKKFIVIFGLTILFWVTNPITHIDNNMVAAVSACIMGLSGIELIKPKHLNEIGWHGIMLVGGATALAMTLSVTGASNWIASMLTDVLGGMSAFMVILIVSIFAMFIHFVVPAGAALVAVFVPIVAQVALDLGMSPAVLALIIGFTVSNCFLMPLDPIPLTTYNFGYWKMGDMTKVGLVVTVAWIILLVLFMVPINMLGILPTVVA